MNSGYIKLHRKILDNPLVMKSSDHFAIWMYLLLNAAHKKYDTLIGPERVTLNPGQLVTGRKKIAKDLKINESKIQRILKLFEIEQQIEQRTNSVSRVISIVNWCDYQQSEHQSEQRVNNERTLNNNKRNTINIYIDQFNEFWELVSNKVSKGQANKNYQRLDKEWALQPKELAKAYNDYYNSISEKKYVKQPAFWLSAEKYLDEKPKEYSKEEEEDFKLKSYVDMFRKGIRLPIWSKQQLDELEALAKQSD